MKRKTITAPSSAIPLGKIDILVGTQMMRKGYISRTSRWWELFRGSRVASAGFPRREQRFNAHASRGRAGRGDIEGEVVGRRSRRFIRPFNCARHDFKGFYEQELEFREH